MIHYLIVHSLSDYTNYLQTSITANYLIINRAFVIRLYELLQTSITAQLSINLIVHSLSDYTNYLQTSITAQLSNN